jgi:FkbM family methyltransferase
MKKVGGVWLPSHETHLVDWMQGRNEVVDGKLTYQHHKLQRALGQVRNWRTAVDVGAHCGLWSMHLVKRFSALVGFEPVALHRECYARNVEGDYMLHACALGDKAGKVKIHTSESSSGDSWVDGDGDIPLMMLDGFNLQDVDFIKLDCEGYEYFALKGGEETLKRCRPTVMVEQKPGRAQKFGLAETQAVDYLQSLGAKLRFAMSGDYCLSWD